MFAGVKEELAEDVKVYSSFSCGDHRSFGTGEGSGEIAVMEILVRHKNFFFFFPTIRVVKDRNRFARQYVEHSKPDKVQSNLI